MTTVASLTLVVPVLAGGLVAGLGRLLGRRSRDTLAILAAVATLVLALAVALSGDLVVSWAGGWEPVDGKAIGIPLAVDPFGAGLAALAALLGTAALGFSWRYFEAIGTLYHVLMLLFLGGMVGFALSGDLFNLFVFFELLTTAAYALTAYQIDQEGPLQGSLNFAVINTIGAFLLLHGVGMLYAITGTLNLADMGQALATTDGGIVVIVAFTLLSVGLFTKAALLPFHFWLADAHSVAPSPVSVLLSGVMIELGLYGWARIYWTVFADPFTDTAPGLRSVLVGLGAVTALVAGVLALAQFHLKRLLAYSSVSHSGLILLGIAMLDAPGLAGAALYTVGHGLVKGALFLGAGILLHHHGTVDEGELRAAGRRQPVVGVLLVVATLGLAGSPLFATALGRQLIEEQAALHGIGWLRLVFLAAEALTAGAVLRMLGRVFLGWGPQREQDEAEPAEDEEPETSPAGDPRGRAPAVMWIPTASLVLLALVAGSWPGAIPAAERAADLFVDSGAYQAAVMQSVPTAVPPAGELSWLTTNSVVLGLIAMTLAVGIALVGLFRDRLPDTVTVAARRMGERPLQGLRGLQSGHVGDYAAWLTAGTAGLGGLFWLVLG